MAIKTRTTPRPRKDSPGHVAQRMTAQQELFMLEEQTWQYV